MFNHTRACPLTACSSEGVLVPAAAWSTASDCAGSSGAAALSTASMTSPRAPATSLDTWRLESAALLSWPFAQELLCSDIRCFRLSIHQEKALCLTHLPK